MAAPRKPLDPELLAILRDQQEQIDHEFDRTVEVIVALLLAAAIINELRSPAEVKKQAIAEIRSLFQRIDDITVFGVDEAARTRMEQAATRHLPRLFADGYTRTAQKWQSIADNFARDYATRFRTIPNRADGVTFSSRIVTVRTSTERTVRNIITNGVREGMSPERMAQQIRKYLKPEAGGPKVSAWEQARANAGTPRGVYPTNARYNAIRIARTEALETWDEATLRFYKDSPFVKDDLWDFVLSNSHKVTDICDTLADGSPYILRLLPRKPHPFCMCERRPHLRTASEIRAILDDNEDAFL